MNAQIHVVDDDADFRDALSWLFDSRGHAVAVWPGGEEFLQVAQTCCDAWGHAVVLLDIRMAPVSGLTTFERLKDMGCPWPVLFLTGHGDVSMAVTAVKSGAWDFLEKPFQNNVLVDKVEQALAEAQVRVGTSAEQQRLRLALANLSPRELEVLDELILGHYNKTIADHLGVTPRTIEFHRANIFEKLAVDSAIELAHKLGRYGLRWRHASTPHHHTPARAPAILAAATGNTTTMPGLPRGRRRADARVLGKAPGCGAPGTATALRRVLRRDGRTSCAPGRWPRCRYL